MDAHRWLLTLAAALLATLWSARAGAESAIEHRVQVQQVGRTLLAVRAAGGNLTADMGFNERVLWRGACGDLGAVVTDRRVLVATATGAEWREHTMRLGEPAGLEASISSRLVLISVGRRVVGYDAATDRFLEWRHHIWERPVDVVTEREVGVVIYASGVVGYTVGGSGFTDHGFRLSESYRSNQASASIVTVQTSHRLLSFTATTNAWAETPRPLGQ